MPDLPHASSGNDGAAGFLGGADGHLSGTGQRSGGGKQRYDDWSAKRLDARRPQLRGDLFCESEFGQSTDGRARSVCRAGGAGAAHADARRCREIADAVPFVEGPPEALQGMDYNWITNEYYFEDDTQDYTAGDILGRGDHDIAVLIRELLQPSPLNEFLEARSAVRSRQRT